jgi:hypothetical protein
MADDIDEQVTAHIREIFTVLRGSNAETVRGPKESVLSGYQAQKERTESYPLYLKLKGRMQGLARKVGPTL